MTLWVRYSHSSKTTNKLDFNTSSNLRSPIAQANHSSPIKIWMNLTQHPLRYRDTERTEGLWYTLNRVLKQHLSGNLVQNRN